MLYSLVMNNEKIDFKMLCQPFAAYGTGQWDIRVNLSDKTVRVFDPIVHCYTLTHALTPASQRCAIRKARKLVAEQKALQHARQEYELGAR